MIYDFENLFNAYKAGIKCKRYRPDVMAYTDKLEENLIELQNEFIWETYTVGRYNIFYVYEPKKRMIMSLTFKDRVAQHAIYSQLNPYFEKQFISDSYACRVGKGTHKAVNRLHDWLKQTDRKPQRFYYLKLDIAKYFYRMGKPYPEPQEKPASKYGLFCGYYGSTDDYIKQPEEKEVTDSGSNTDA